MESDEEYSLGEGIWIKVISKGTRCKFSTTEGDRVTFHVPELGEMNEVCLEITNSNGDATFDVSVSYEDYKPSVYRMDPSETLEVDRYTDSNWPLALYSANSAKYHNVSDSQRGKVTLIATKVTPSRTGQLLKTFNHHVIPDHESPEYSTKSLLSFEETLPGVPVEGSIPLKAVVFLKLLDAY